MDNRYRSELRVGMNVSSMDGKRLGKVKDVGSGTFDVERGFFIKRAFSATYDEIARIDSDGVTLDLSEAELNSYRSGSN